MWPYLAQRSCVHMVSGLIAIRQMEQFNQCIYCLTQALKVDPSDVEALWDLATIHRTLDNKLKVGSDI